MWVSTRREKSLQVCLHLQEIDNMDKPGNLVFQSLSPFLLTPKEPFRALQAQRFVVVLLQRSQIMIHSGLHAVQEEKYLLAITCGTEALSVWLHT